MNSFSRTFSLLGCLLISASAFGQVQEWQIRQSIHTDPISHGGVGRKMAIRNGTVVVGTSRSDFILVADAVRDNIRIIVDPFENRNAVAADLVEDESFGYAVAIAETDSGTMILVGDTGRDIDENFEPIEDLLLASPGQAHLYNVNARDIFRREMDFSNPVLTTNVMVEFPGGTTLPFNIGSQFGHDVAFADDWAAIGAPFDAQQGGVDFAADQAGSGKAFLFDTSSPLGTAAINELIDPTPALGDKFGAYMAVSQGLVAASDHCDNSGYGCVHLYDTAEFSVDGGRLSPVLTIERVGENEDAEQFGWDTDMHEDLLLIGHTFGASLYRVTADSAQHIFTINSPLDQPHPNFGRLVALDGDRIAIAQQGIESAAGVELEGLVFVYNFDVSAGTFDLEQQIADPTFTAPVFLENFPTALDIEGDFLLIGSSRQGVQYNGESYVYDFGRLIGDVNRDGVIDLLDIQAFVDAFLNGEFQVEADANQDGSLDLLDIQAFVDLILSVL